MNLVRLLLLSALISLFLTTLNVTVFGSILPLMYLPNLFVVLVILITLEHDSWLGVVTIFFVGIFADISSGLLIGPWSAGFLLVYVVLSAVADRVFVESFFTRVIVSATCNVIASIAFIALSVQVLPSLEETLVLVLYQTIATGLIGPIFFPIFRFVLGKSKANRTEYPSILYSKR